MSGIVHWLQALHGPVAYTVIAALVFGEAAVFIGFVLPGETAVVIGGVLAATGRLQLPVLLVLVVAAAILGDTVGYEVGRHLGTRALATRPLRRHQSRIEGAQRFLRRRGGMAVFLGRFTAFLRAVMPGLAGTSQMSYPRFLAFNAAGGVVWGVGVALLGFFAGNSYQAAESTLGRTSAIVLALVVVAGLLIWHRQRRHRTREPDGEAREPVES
jgi:membrane protein DedA with SNARE-associated domain